MRAGHPAQQIDDRQSDGHQHAVQHAEASTATVVSAASSSSLRRNRAIRRNLRDVDQPDRREDHQCAERGLREARQQRAGHDERQQDQDQDDQGIQLGPAADGSAQRGPACAATDREAVEQRRCDVPRAECGPFLVGVDPFVPA